MNKDELEAVCKILNCLNNISISTLMIVGDGFDVIGIEDDVIGRIQWNGDTDQYCFVRVEK